MQTEQIATNHSARQNRGGLRTCIACKTERDVSLLCRFVGDLDGARLLIDMRQRLPGRGAYVCRQRKCVEDAVKTGAFKRMLNVSISKKDIVHLMGLLTSTTEKLIADVISLARRAGAVSVGREAVKRSMKEDQTGALLMANDLSDSSVRQILDNAGRKRVPVYSPFSGQELASKVGMDFVSILGIDREPFVSRIVTLCSSYDELNEKS